MSISSPWTSATPASSVRKNKTSIITVDGDTAAGLDKTKFKLIAIDADGIAGDEDDLLMVNADADAFINLRQTPSHRHSGSSDGGDFTLLHMGGNSDDIDLMLTKTTDLKKAQWDETVTGTGSIEDITDGSTGERAIRLRPNGTSGSGSTITYPHIRLNFSNAMLFQTKLRIETFSSIALHTGIQCDLITDADSNTQKLQAELCTATNNNWWLRTASGSAHSASDTGIAATANRVAIKIEHYPDLGTPETNLYIDTGTVLQKTTNIPTTGTTSRSNIIRHSVKNSTASDRPLLMYGCRVFGDATSSDWV